MPTTTLTNHDIVPAFNALARLGKFPAGQTGAKVALIIAALKPVGQAILDQESALREECAARDDEGTLRYVASDDGTNDSEILIDPKRRHEFTLRHREFMRAASEIVAPRLSQFEYDQAVKKVGFEPGLLMYLLPFVDPAPAPDDGPLNA
jgi:hypothetical protein